MTAKNPHAMTEQERLQWLITHNRALRCQLGGYRFWINPDSITFLREWLYAEAPTVGGYGVWDFGTKPYQFTLVGSTGTMGEFDIDDKTALGGVHPRFNTPNRMTTWSIPGRGKWNVRVVSIEDHVSKEKPHAYFYTISLRVYDEAKASYVKVYSANTTTNGVKGPIVPAANRTTPGIQRRS